MHSCQHSYVSCSMSCRECYSTQVGYMWYAHLLLLIGRDTYRSPWVQCGTFRATYSHAGLFRRSSGNKLSLSQDLISVIATRTACLGYSAAANQRQHCDGTGGPFNQQKLKSSIFMMFIGWNCLRTLPLSFGQIIESLCSLGKSLGTISEKKVRLWSP